MKRIAFICLLLLISLPTQISQAQTEVTALEKLQVDLWPDYDRSAVLVLLTGALPEGTTFPAMVTLPLPEGADFNVVARIDASDGNMKDDIEFTTDAGKVSFTTPDLAFRIEYYLPYTADGLNRSFNFTWVGGMPVNQLQVSVQQPTAATSLITEPAATSSVTGRDGFTYHTLPAQVVPAGQPYAVRLNYTMSSAQLSVPQAGPLITDVQTTGFTSRVAPESGPDWPIIVAAAVAIALAVALITWQIATSRATAKSRKPRPVRVESSTSTVRYCHICGQPLQSGDKFCRECGTAVKSR